MSQGKKRASRYHDISAGHRVVGHENKCRHLHGHNYRVHFHCEAPALDNIGRVIDFGVIKEKLCMWIEEHWDHKFLAWSQDEVMCNLLRVGVDQNFVPVVANESVVWLPFNPTAENMAEYLVNTVGPVQLRGTGVTLVSVEIEETAKCSASYTKD